MKCTYYSSIICILSLIPVLPALAQDAGTAGGYRLVWADEFNKEGAPDNSNWQYERGYVRNHELQWYQPQNAYCHNGSLVIEARKEHLPNPIYTQENASWKTSRQFIEYTSASLNTRGQHSWQYGRFIMRARIEVDPGLWPAFWTLGTSKPWPSNGEIDIMEYYRGQLLANIACGTATPSKAKWFTTMRPVDSLGVDWSKEFHTWRMDWDERSISLYMDDRLLNHVPLDQLVNQDGSNFNPFMQPHYILLNLAVGGDSGGNPSSTTFPRRYEIDYVRVYQK